MFGMGPWELILILVIALVIFGPSKLPEMGQALGKGLREFRQAVNPVREAAGDDAGMAGKGVAGPEGAAGAEPGRVAR